MKILYFILTLLAGFIIGLFFDKPCNCKENICKDCNSLDSIKRTTLNPNIKGCQCSKHL